MEQKHSDKEWREKMKRLQKIILLVMVVMCTVCMGVGVYADPNSNMDPNKDRKLSAEGIVHYDEAKK